VIEPDPPLVRIAQHDTVRLVASGRLKKPALEPLLADANDLQRLAALEARTSTRLQAEAGAILSLPPSDMASRRANYSFVNAAFAYTRPQGNRFNGGERGAWYCAFAVATALAEVGYHLTRALADIGRFDNATDYGELLADFIGAFHDLRGAKPKAACLDPDPAIGYPAGQALARRLRAAQSPGLIYPSARDRKGINLVAFEPAAVQNVRQGSLWRLTWSGSPAFEAKPIHANGSGA
jgi:hypothetical protein